MNQAKSLFLLVSLLFCLNGFSQEIGLNLGTAEDDQWEFAGNVVLKHDIRRSSRDFSKVDIIELRQEDDKLLMEEVENFVAPAVPLLAFAAERKLRGVEVSWTCPQLEIGSRLVLQRSENGFDWKDILQLHEPTSGIGLQKFNFLDTTQHMGTNIYRLKLTSNEFQPAYSNSIAVEVLAELTHTTYLYPNPLIFGTLIELELFQAMEVEIKILDPKFDELALIYSKLCSLGKHFVELNMDGLPKGNYICSIKTGDKTTFRNLTK